ncbi:MAG: hypothetical protein QW759_03325 [Candidatus Micrarchaeaceae archaeon]
MAGKLNYAMWTILLTSFLGTSLMARPISVTTSISTTSTISPTTIAATTPMSANQLLSSQLCGIVNGVRTIIGIIALVMFLIGGVLYAIAHFLPSAGQIKGNLQGWAMGMIIGGIVGLILVIIAPYIINQVMAFGNGITATSC